MSIGGFLNEFVWIESFILRLKTGNDRTVIDLRSRRCVEGLFEAQHREQTPGPQGLAIDDLEVLAHHDAVEVEHGPPAELVAERRHAPLDPAAHTLFLAEMIDQDDLASGLAHPRRAKTLQVPQNPARGWVVRHF